VTVGQRKNPDARASLRVVRTPGPRAPVAVALVATLLACAGLAGAGAPRKTSVRPALETNLAQAVNAVRVSRGLAPLGLSSALAAAASQHSLEMVQNGYFSHDGVGLSYARRLAAYYPRGRYRRWMVGEVLAWGSPSLGAREAVGLWLRSPEHRRNLLKAGWRDFGVSAVHAAGAPGTFQGLDVTVITVDFGLRS
jgi:uncharacterized protein YkwD